MSSRTHICAICDKRPSPPGQYCGHCQAQIASIAAAERKSQSSQPERFVSYKGFTVALFPVNPDPSWEEEFKVKYRAVPIRQEVGQLPKSKTVNLDTYVEGLTRHQVKKLKALVMSTCSN